MDVGESVGAGVSVGAGGLVGFTVGVLVGCGVLEDPSVGAGVLDGFTVGVNVGSTFDGGVSLGRNVGVAVEEGDNEAVKVGVYLIVGVMVAVYTSVAMGVIDTIHESIDSWLLIPDTTTCRVFSKLVEARPGVASRMPTRLFTGTVNAVANRVESSAATLSSVSAMVNIMAAALSIWYPKLSIVSSRSDPRPTNTSSCISMTRF